MRELIIPWASIALRALLLVRGVRTGWATRYPFFYGFLAGALGVDALLMYVYAKAPASYPIFYWWGEFLTLILACGIVLEIFRNVLALYPGVERLARITGILAFTTILLSSGVYPILAQPDSVGRTMATLERNVRAVQAIFLLAVLLLISYYGIQIGKNMKGMMLGYGLSIASSLMNLAAYSHAGRFAAPLLTARQLGYALAILIWTVTLWAYAPNPADAPATRIGEDYEQLVRIGPEPPWVPYEGFWAERLDLDRRSSK